MTFVSYQAPINVKTLPYDTKVVVTYDYVKKLFSALGVTFGTYDVKVLSENFTV